MSGYRFGNCKRFRIKYTGEWDVRNGSCRKESLESIVSSITRREVHSFKGLEGGGWGLVLEKREDT